MSHRPMPGPPEYWWYCTPPHGEPGLWTSDMDPAEYMPFTHLQHKRLTDAECEREWEAFEQDASTALLLHTLGDKRVPAWRFKRFHHGANTWHRFATRPHALEES